MRYHFEGVTLISDRRELLRGELVVDVAPQVFDLIEYLIRHRTRVVTKDELIDRIWNGRIVSDTALTSRIYIARKAIGDLRNRQRLIKTIPRRGWRFVGVVREDDSSEGVASAGATALERNEIVYAAAQSPVVAVPSFRMFPGGDLPDAIGERLAEDICVGLSKLTWMRVRACINTDDHLPLLGTDGDLRYVLQGTVHRVGPKVRATARLIEAVTGATIWGDRFDGKWVESLSAYDGISDRISGATAGAVARAEQKRSLQTRAGDRGAWETYQLGLWHLSKAEAAENKIAGHLFQLAIDMDPNFGPAHAALAWSHMATSSAFSGMTVAESCELAEPLIRKAIALDEDDREPRARLALIAMLRGDLAGAAEQADQILSVDSRCGDAWGVKGAALIYAGRLREGRRAIRRYFSLGPRDIARPLRLTQIAVSEYLDGGYEAAVATAREVILCFPRHPFAYRWLAASLGQLGRVAEARETLQALETKWPTSFEMYVSKPPPQFCSSEYKPLLAGLRKAGWKG
jgi:adenylate cyclase